MFDRFVDAFVEGHFRVTIDVKETPNGDYEASWTAPNGTVISATNDSQSQAHRDVEQKIREGVLSREITLGR